MVDFSEEQEAEMQKRIKQARELEQYRIAGLQAYKAAEIHLTQLVDVYDDKGMLVKKAVFDPFVLTVFRNEMARFTETYFPQKGPEPKQDE